MKVLIDMNLSPEWVEVLERNGFEARHWGAVGDPGAADFEILEWARENAHIVFTNDLDFGRLLALTNARGPSVFQIRGGRLLPEDADEMVLTALAQCRKEFVAGSLITLDESAWRVRILPIK